MKKHCLITEWNFSTIKNFYLLICFFLYFLFLFLFFHYPISNFLFFISKANLVCLLCKIPKKIYVGYKKKNWSNWRVEISFVHYGYCFQYLAKEKNNNYVQKKFLYCYKSKLFQKIMSKIDISKILFKDNAQLEIEDTMNLTLFYYYFYSK